MLHLRGPWAFALALASTLPAHAALPLAPIVISGEPAAGVPGAAYQFSYAPLVNQQGEVAFATSLSGAGNLDFAIFVGRRDDMQIVFREGDPAPGTSANFTTISGFTLNGLAANRQMLVHGYLNPSSPGVTFANDEIVYSGAPNAMVIVGREDDPFPPSNTLSTSGVAHPYLASSGALGYSRVDLFSNASGAIQPVGLLNQPAPGADGQRFGGFSLSSMNDAGVMAVVGFLYRPEGQNFSGFGLWRIDPQSPATAQKISLSHHDIAPGTELFFDGYGETSINNAGRIAFVATLAEESPQRLGIWIGEPGAIEPLALSGGVAPIPGGQHTFVNWNTDETWGGGLPLSGNGEAAFFASLAGPGIDEHNNQALFQGDSASNLRVVARKGDAAPGTAPGVAFKHFSATEDGRAYQPTLNALGQAVFYATLTGPGVTTDNDVGLWATNVFGDPILVAREGDQIELAPGIFQTIANISFATASGGQDARRMAFNDAGQLVMWLSMTDAPYGAVVMATVDLSADFNRDGFVNADDLDDMRPHLGMATGASRAQGDADLDGDVDGRDFLVWQRQLGTNPGGQLAARTSHVVPEPTAAMLLLMALAARRRVRHCSRQ